MPDTPFYPSQAPGRTVADSKTLILVTVESLRIQGDTAYRIIKHNSAWRGVLRTREGAVCQTSLFQSRDTVAVEARCA